MVHAVRIKDGKASFCNRYVQTSKLRQEQRAGKPIFAKVGRRGGGTPGPEQRACCLPGALA